MKKTIQETPFYSMCHESFNQQEFTNLFLKKDSLFGDVFSVNILEAQTRRLNVNTDRFVKYLIKSKIIYDKGPVYEYLYFVDEGNGNPKILQYTFNTVDPQLYLEEEK